MTMRQIHQPITPATAIAMVDKGASQYGREVSPFPFSGWMNGETIRKACAMPNVTARGSQTLNGLWRLFSRRRRMNRPIVTAKLMIAVGYAIISMMKLYASPKEKLAISGENRVGSYRKESQRWLQP